MEVRVREKCTACEGVGIVPGPYWDEFWQAWSRWMAEHPRREAAGPAAVGERNAWRDERQRFEAEWWADRGYPGGPWKWPAEEESCGDCEGAGHTEKWLPLEEFLALITVEFSGWSAGKRPC